MDITLIRACWLGSGLGAAGRKLSCSRVARCSLGMWRPVMAGPSGHGIAQEARSMTICAAHAKSCRRSPCALLPRSLEAGLRRFVRNPSYPRSIRPCSARWCRFHRAELALGSGISGRTGVLRLRAPPYGALFRAVLPRVGRLYVACVMSNFDHSRASRTRSFRWRPSRRLIRPLWSVRP